MNETYIQEGQGGGISFQEIIIIDSNQNRQNKYPNQGLELRNISNLNKETKEHQQEHVSIGDLIKSFVYGGVDGVTNMLIVILSGFSSSTDPKLVLAMCVSICIGDGIVMGLGDYLSARAEIDYIKSQEAREYKEVKNLIEDEKKEIVQIYSQRYYSLQDSQRIADLYSQSQKAFVDIMMLEELGLAVVDPILAMKCGVVTFFSFLIFGILPVLPYIAAVGILKKDVHPWIPSLIIGSVQLFALGLIKAYVIGLNKLKSGLQILLIGLAATAVGYGIGTAFKN